MLVGYNTNIPYRGIIYHVQTEDNGIQNPVIVTLLYSQGAILSSKKTSYAHILSVPDYEQKVREMMKAQHKAMIKELIAGKYTGDLQDKGQVKAEVKVQEKCNSETAGRKDKDIQQATETQTAKAVKEPEQEKEQKEDTPSDISQQRNEKRPKDQISKSLDDILLNFIMKRAK
jgi:carbamoylphosphate synthase small subunit